MNQHDRRRPLSSEEIRRLEKNPFVDKEMVQFLRKKQSGGAARFAPSPATPASPQKGVPPRAETQNNERSINEKTIQLITAAIKGMMRE